MLIPLYRPTLRRKDLGSVLDVLASDRIGPGPLGRELSAAVCRVAGAAGGVSLCSYRSAVGSALDALGVGEGDPVIVSALAPRLYLDFLNSWGVRPRPVDVQPGCVLPSMEGIESELKSGPCAVVMHYGLGSAGGGDQLFELGVPVLEDVSQALGGQWGGQPCGSRGAAGVSSLGAEGVITCGCGAVAFSADRRVAARLKETAQEAAADRLLPDMNAALGLAQLRGLDRFLARRREIAEVYRQALLRSRHEPLFPEPGAVPVPFGFPVLLKDGLPEVRQYATKKGAQTAPAFQDSIAASTGSDPPSPPLPNSRELLRRCLLFPLYPSLSRKEVQLLCRILSTLP